jgi:hypothetical protein
MTRRTTVTLVGSCSDPVCVANGNLPTFALSQTAYAALAMNGEPMLPSSGAMLTYSFVACPDPNNAPILANVRLNNGTAGAVLFAQQRYGIKSATIDGPTGQPTDLSRGNDNYWTTASGILTNASSAIFHIVDVNNVMITTSSVPLANPQAFYPTGVQFPVCPSP